MKQQKRLLLVGSLMCLLSHGIQKGATPPGTRLWDIVIDTLKKSCTVDSQIDVVAMEIIAIASTVDQLAPTSLSQEILSKACIIDSKVDQVSEDLSSDVDGLQVAIMILKECVLTVDSKVDELDILVRDIQQSKICVIDSKIDVVSSEVDVLQTTANTIDSKIDIIDSKISIIAPNNSLICGIDSKVDKIISDLLCTPTIITTLVDIITPGNYCFANDIVGTFSIDAPRVNLDLNGKLLTGGIILTSDADDVSIKHGIIDASFGTGIDVTDGTISNLHISDLTIMNGVSGLSLEEVSNLAIGNLTVTDADENASLFSCFDVLIEGSVFNSATVAAGLNLLRSFGVEIRKCTAQANATHGIVLTTCSNTKIQDCTCYNHTGVGSVGILFEEGDCHEVLDTEASGNTVGFMLTTSYILFRDCLACSNTDQGFYVQDPSVGVCIVSCEAKDNDIGFDVSGSVIDGILKDNLALGNSTCGFDNSSTDEVLYVGNFAKDNASGVAAGNYCVARSPVALGTLPFSQVDVPSATSSWNNVSA